MCAHYGDNQGVAPDTCLLHPRLQLTKDNDVPQQCIDNGDYTPNTEHLLDEETDAEKLRELAMDVLQHGDPLEYMVQVVNTMHVGDQQAARLLILSMLVQNVVNSKGFHPGLHGPSGKGKTDLCKAVKHIAPRGYVIETSLSGKALFYAGLKQGVVVFCDDLDLNDELRSTLKRATTNFTEPTMHTTVIQGKAKTLTIPPRVTWWLTSVDADSDEQVLNREIPCDIDESAETDEAVFKHQLNFFRTGLSPFQETNEVRICRAMLKIIKSERYNVIAPFAKEDRVIWENKNNRRNFDVFVDLVKSIAVLYRFQRKTYVNLDGTITIEAIEDDFKRAMLIYGAFGQSQATKLTKSELNILKYLASRAQKEKQRYGIANIYEIQEGVGLSRGRVHHILHGKDGKTGLLYKVPALSYEPETEHVDVQGDELDSYGRPIIIKRKSRPRNIYKLDTQRFDPFKNYEVIASLK